MIFLLKNNHESRDLDVLYIFSFNGHNIQFEVSPPLFLFQVYLFVMQRGFLLCFMSNMAANKTIYSLEPSR